MHETKSFEDFIIKCCAMDEWDLRDFLRQELKSNGFSIQEDNYKSPRGGKYEQVHNMLAIRGEKARVCLVAHTDVVRDHGRGEHHKTDPVVKEIERYGMKQRIIQDKNCKVQVGGDDRLGVAINTWIALHTGYDMGLLFTSDEEIGNLSSEECDFKDLMKFDICVQVDRGNHSNQLVTQIGGTRLCDNKTALRLLVIAKSMGLPRNPVNGMMTDVLELTRNKKIRNAVNMTCGYHQSHGSSEYIDIEESHACMLYVNKIIQDYELETIEKVNDEEETDAEIMEMMRSAHTDMSYGYDYKDYM